MTEKSVTEPRSRRRRKDTRPAEIVEAGLAEFGARGFAATRMEDVARRAGVAKGTVFLYFPNKEALFEAVLSTRIAFFDQGLPEPEESAGPELVRTLVTGFYEALARPEVRALMRIIITEGPRFPAILESWHRILIQRAQAALGRSLAQAVAAGAIRPGPLTDLPMVLAGPAIMAAVWGMTFDAVQPIPLERFRDAHLDLVARALAGAPGDGGPAEEAARP